MLYYGNFVLYFYSTLYIIFPPSMVLQSRQNMKKSMYLGPFQQNFIPKYTFIFIMSSAQIF
jgi:hypothetical protein